MKFIKILLIVLSILFVTILAIPFVFKSQLMELAKEEVNKSVKAKVDWTRFSVSLFKGFPDLRVSMENMSVVGIELFENDTLMAFDEFAVKVDLLSAFSGKVKIKSVILNSPVVHAIALEEGANWDITYPSEEIIEEADTTSSEMEMTFSLKEFVISNARIYYYDEVYLTMASIEGFDLNMSGDLSETFTTLDLKSFAKSLTVEYDGIKYLNKCTFKFDALLNSDLENMKFEISDNVLQINDLVLGLEGIIGIPEEADADLDIRFFSKETSFKTLLSMVPAIYASDFADLKTSGMLEIEGTAKGLVVGDIYPLVNLNLKVKDGYFAYPDLPEAVKNVGIDLQVFYDGIEEDNTRVDLNAFHMELAGNPVDMNFHVRTPMSDMQLNGKIISKIELSSLKNAIPLDNMNLQGLIVTDLELMGKMSDIENENYEDFHAEGSLEVSNMIVEGDDIPVPVNLQLVKLLFSPKFVNLEAFDAKLGESDIHLNGRLENFIPYVFEDGIIKGELNFASNNMNINELMGEEIAEEETAEDTSVLSVIEIPANINFKLKTQITNLIYDNIEIRDLYGMVLVNEGIAKMEELRMNLLEGSLLLSGEYNTSDMSAPSLAMNMDMKNINIEKAAVSFNTIEKLMPVAEMCRGKVSVLFNFTSLLDSTMYPVLNSIEGKGNLRSDEIKLENNETFSKIGKMVKKPDLADKKFKDVYVNFLITDGRVIVEPFDTKLGDSKLRVGGSQGLDLTLDYNLDFKIPRSEFGSTSNDIFEDFAAQATAKGFALNPGDDINLAVKLLGTYNDPKISMNVKENLSNTKTQVKAAVEKKVVEKVEEVKQEVRQNVSAEVDKIMKDAELKAQKIKQEAKDAGVALVGEAELRRKQLIKEAGSNPVKKLAAEKTGDALVKKAKEQAADLEKTANEKADKLMAEAQAKADAIKSK
ncbi:MAG: hypothetical protein K9H49_19630 [Bacteroidales bacterium]|nr:hypothetical protein [Bacteroidales bacterium]MCF8391958.1 hypothetical protein [Bacteroidales bacterium]